MLPFFEEARFLLLLVYYRHQSTLKRLETARMAIEIAQSDAFLGPILARFGFPEDELARGQKIQTTADRYFSMRDLEYGNQVSATRHLRTLSMIISNRLRDDRSIVRIVFRGSKGIARRLRVDIKLARSYEGLHSQAGHFYQEILSDEALLSALTPYSITRDAAQEQVTRVAELAEAMKAQQVQFGQAQLTTASLHAAMADLDAWMSQFIGAARLAFRQDPKQLKKLGIYIKPGRTKQA